MAGLLLAWANPGARLVGLELQPRLADLAWRNACLNGLAGSFSVVEGDARDPEVFAPASFDLILANPPYRPVGAGRLGPDEERNLARHELSLNLAQWTAAAAGWLKPAGRLCVVYPAWRLAALLNRLEAVGFWPGRLRLVYAWPGGPGRRVLVEARASAGVEMAVEPPLFLRSAPEGQPSAELAALTRGELSGTA